MYKMENVEIYKCSGCGKVIETLPQKQKEIYHLREIEEMTYQEIAEILSISLAEVKIGIFRTRKKIRDNINKIEAYGLAN